MFDTHIHIMNRQPADPAGLLTALQATGFRGGVRDLGRRPVLFTRLPPANPMRKRVWKT